MTVILYHNPGCSKSRPALALLREGGIEPATIEYLQNAPSPEQLSQLISLPGMKAPESVLEILDHHD